MIEIKNLNKSYTTRVKSGVFGVKEREVNAIKNLTLNFDKPEIVGLVGNNGAGKTTLIKLICGLLLPDSGEISVLGMTPHSKSKKLLMKLSMLSGRRDALLWDLPISDSFKLFGHIYRIKPYEAEKRYTDLADLFGARSLLEKQAKSLSLGERMKCELIKSLLHKPKILLLDEPTLGLDIESQISFRKHLKVYCETEQSLVLMSSHNLTDIDQTCSRIVGISRGNVVYDSSAGEIVKHEKITYTIRYEDSSSQAAKECVCSLDDLSEQISLIQKELNKRIISIDKDEISLSEAAIREIAKG